MSSQKTTKKLIRGGPPASDTTPCTMLARKLQAVCGVENFSASASLFGVTSMSAKRYLVGKQVPVATALSKLRATTEVDLNWLLDETDTREGPVFNRKRRK